jgi:hypothetical protein
MQATRWLGLFLTITINLNQGVTKMAGLPKSECVKILTFLRDKVQADDLPRLKILLERNIAGGAQDDDDETDAGLNGTFDAESDLMPRSYGMDARGRRLVRPASAKDRQEFEKVIGITSRKIRNLGA